MAFNKQICTEKRGNGHFFTGSSACDCVDVNDVPCHTDVLTTNGAVLTSITIPVGTSV
jgi:hypothetical protein